MPEEQHDVRSGLFREKESAPKDPRHAELAGERNMIQAMPNLTGTRALEEDVCVCFKEIRAQLTSGIFRGAQIPAEQVRTCVQAPMVCRKSEVAEDLWKRSSPILGLGVFVLIGTEQPRAWPFTLAGAQQPCVG